MIVQQRDARLMRYGNNKQNNGKIKKKENKEKRRFAIWQTLFEVDTKYIPINPIGQGSYGVVCSSLNTETNQNVAIKKITNVFANNVEALRALREMMILSHVRHHNVIALKDVMIISPDSNFKDIYLVYELMDTDLHRIIQSNQPLSKEHCQYFMLQMLQGLNFLHTTNIIHRDLKPGNLLVDTECSLKICDFGLARTTKDKGQIMTEYVVTRWYRAPELLCFSSQKYDKSIDIWSVGCIFAELLERRPFSVVSRFMKELPYARGVNLCHRFPEEADPLGIDLLNRMLAFDPNKRITAAEALRHPYLANLCDPKSKYPSQFTFDFDALDDAKQEEIRSLMVAEMEILHLQS